MNFTVERLEEIELERQKTMGNINFQNWIKELNVSRSYVEPKALLQGNDITRQYDYDKYRYKV